MLSDTVRTHNDSLFAWSLQRSFWFMTFDGILPHSGVLLSFIRFVFENRHRIRSKIVGCIMFTVKIIFIIESIAILLSTQHSSLPRYLWVVQHISIAISRSYHYLVCFLMPQDIRNRTLTVSHFINLIKIRCLIHIY